MKLASCCWKNALSPDRSSENLSAILLGDPLAVLRIHPVVRVAQRMDVAHGARDVPVGNLEDRGAERRVQIALRADLNLRVPALLDERRQPADLELAADADQHVGLLQLEDEARLRLDEVRVLIALRHRVDGDVIAADLARDRREILGRRHDVQLALRRRRRARQQEDSGKRGSQSCVVMSAPQNGCAPCAPMENWN